MCLSPWQKMDKKNGRNDMLPCGRCPQCTARRASAWSFRLMQQEKVSDTAYFITLTYDTTHVPITKKKYMTLDKTDLQKFMKRLRKANKSKLKYYAVGEYGTKYMRPHYHLIIFDVDVNTISKAWNLGEVYFGTVTGASVGYTLKYISKPSRIPLHKNDDRTPEFSLMSKKLGINYLTTSMVRWHKADLLNRMYCNLEDGKKITMPRYFKDKIYTDTERNELKYHHQNLLEEKRINAEKKQTFHNYEQAKIAAFKNQKFQSQKNQKL